MDWFDRNPLIRRGGRSRDAATRVNFYHLSFRSGSRGGGACAGAAHAYITRTEEYDDPERDSAVHTESDRMPSWAQDDPRVYWDAADLFERANGRLYLSADFALPRDLEPEDQIALAHTFAQELTILRSRMEFANFVEHRVLTMTPAERRQFDALMKWDVRKSRRPAPQNPRNQNREKD